MPFDESLIAPAVARYRREQDRYKKLADRIAEICRELCARDGVRAHVTSRVKESDSFQKKLERFSKNDEKNYRDQDEIFKGVSDLAGVRVAAYRHEDLTAILDSLDGFFNKIREDGEVNSRKFERDDKDKNATDPNRFYRATHLQVYLPEEECIGGYENIDDVSCEVQICTMMAHVWNEIEHDIVYKPASGAVSEEVQNLLKMLGHTVRFGDAQISTLLKAYGDHKPQGDGVGVALEDIPFDDVHDFISRMKDYGQGGDQRAMPNFFKNSGHVFNLAEYLNLKTPRAIDNHLKPFDVENLRKISKDFGEYLTSKGYSGLAPDSESSDLMLLGFFEKKGGVDAVLGAYQGKVGRGKGWPNRLYRLAKHYQTFKRTS